MSETKFMYKLFCFGYNHDKNEDSYPEKMTVRRTDILYNVATYRIMTKLIDPNIGTIRQLQYKR